jgi:hypothetical protein
MKKFFKTAIDNLKVVVHRFPIVLSVCVIAGVFALMMVHETFADRDIPAKILLSLLMFALTSLCAKIAHESYEKITKAIYIGLLAGGVCLAACFGLFLLNLDYGYSWVRYFAVMIALNALVVAVPYLGKRDGSDGFANRLLWRGAITLLFSGVLIGGLCALFYAMQELLNVDLIDEIYGDTAIAVAALFTPALFLTGVKQLEDFSSHKLFKVLTVYIMMPLLLAYTAVVYAYLIRIVFNNFEMPGGIVGSLVLWYGLVGIWVLFLAKEYLSSGFGKFFNRFYPIASVVPLATMFVALYLRINQYGFTESRYYSLVAGIWLCAMVVFFIVTSFTGKRKNVIVAASFALVALLSVVGPWSAGSVSLRSQTNRLEQALVAEEVLADGDIVEGKHVSDETADILYYIERQHGFDNVPFLTASQASELASFPEGREDSEFYSYHEEFLRVREISGYDYMTELDYTDGKLVVAPGLYYTFNQKGVIEFYMDDAPVLTMDIGEHFEQLLEDKVGIGDSPQNLVFERETQTLRIRLELQNVEFYEQDGSVQMTWYSGRLLIDKK